MSPSVGIVVPAYRPDVDALAAYIDALQTTVEPDVIRVELDDPRDDPDVIRERIDAAVAIARHRRGKGMAITAGFETLDTDILAFVDADGSTAPTSVATIIDPISSGTADLVVGTRHHAEATIPIRPPILRRFLSRGFVTLARLITGIRLGDFQCGAKAISREAWATVRDDLSEPGFGWDLEVLWLAHRRNFHLDEVPITWTDQPDSTVAPTRTAVHLAGLLSRLAIARIRASDRIGPNRPRLLDRLATIEEI